MGRVLKMVVGYGMMSKRGDDMFRYETHLHTYPVSRCAKASVEEMLTFYKEKGYAGVFITNHFLDGNINIPEQTPYEAQIEFYFSDYEKGKAFGQNIGLDVFCGVELSYGGTDFLIYGLDKDWYLAHPQIMEMEKSEELAFLMESGALVIQAHPYREAKYIDHIRLYPRHVHGVEVVNACRKDSENKMAAIYAENYELLEFAGTDNHKASGQKKLAGLCFAEPVCDVEDFIDKVKNKKAEIFTMENE